MKPSSFSYDSMGTSWEITIWDKINPTPLKKIQTEITSLSNDFNNTYSRFEEKSLVSKISKKSGRHKVPAGFMNMLVLYKDLFESTGGKVNPLVGKTLEDLGYDKNYSLKPKGKISQVPNLNTVSIIDSGTIETRIPLLFDFGALGKGYFVDIIKEILLKQNLRHFLINGSGDMYYMGEKPITAGLEHPNDSTKVIGVKTMTTGALCASANNRRRWGKFTHTIDPLTLNTEHEIIATWVASEKAAIADALATALFFVSPERLRGKYDFEYLMLNKNYRVKTSKDFNAKLY